MASFEEDFDSAVKLACLALSVENCKELQNICIEHLLRKKDVLACFPTGYGKSCIYQAWPIVCSELAGVMFNSTLETCKHDILSFYPTIKGSSHRRHTSLIVFCGVCGWD